MVYSCEMCFFKSASRISTVQHVVRNHRHDLNFLTNCRFPDCNASYRNWVSFKSHVARKHKYEEVLEQDQPGQELGGNVDDIFVNEIQLGEQHDFEGAVEEIPFPVDALNEIRGQYVKYIQLVREGCNISQKATDTITAGIIQFSEDSLAALKAHLLQSVQPDGMISSASIEQIFEDFKLSTAIEDVKTKYLLDQFLVESGFLIMPQSVNLGYVWSWVKKPRLHLARKHINFYEVSFFAQLQQLLNQDDILHCVDHPRAVNNKGLLTDYQDGTFVKMHPIFGNCPDSLMIILYYDDVEIVNPLGSKVKSHKLAMFYWTLGNIYPECRSTLKVVNLLCIVKSVHLRKYGMNKILETFVRDMKILESSEGKIMLIKGLERRFRGSLLMFTGDTLAANYVGGFKEGVAFAKKPCRSCLGTDVSTKIYFRESQFVLRDKVTHSEQCAVLSEPGLPKDAVTFWSKEFGLTGRSLLCDIETFDITTCLVQDIMHVIIEGVLEMEIRLFLKYCIENLHIKLKKLNNDISGFNYEHLVKDKPSLIERRHLDNKLRQNCAQLITLGNTLPFIVGDYLEDDNERLMNLTLLLQILNSMMAFEISIEDVELLKTMIDVHHSQFVLLYRGPTPKFHYMVHLPTQIMLFGPLRHQWCMRFEGAHCRFKHMASVVKSFKNIELTLSYRHQSLRCAELFNLPHDPPKNVLCKGDVVPPGRSIKLGDHEHFDCVAHSLNDFDVDKVILKTRNLAVKGTFYKIGTIILLNSNEDDLPKFGKIIDIIVSNSTKLLLYEKIETVWYERSYNAYKVNASFPKIICATHVNQLIHPHALSMFRVKNDFYVPLLNHRRNEFF